MTKKLCIGALVAFLLTVVAERKADAQVLESYTCIPTSCLIFGVELDSSRPASRLSGILPTGAALGRTS
jgi:hypothetical protein